MRCFATLAAGALMVSACVAGPVPEVATPAPSMPQSFAYTPAANEAAALADLLPQSDAAFRALSGTAMTSAPNLAEALARIDAARANAGRAGAARLPSVAVDGSVSATRINPAQFGSDLPGGIAFDTEQTAYGANLSASWDADIFGALRASERAAIARIDAATATARAVRVALVGEIATSVIDWRTLAAREAALQEDVNAAQRLAGLTGAREEAGLSPGFDRVRAEAAASSSRSRLAALQSERVRLVGRLVTLTGQSAQDVQAMLALGAGDDVMPPAPAALPSQLLANRPDIAAAEAELMASDAQLAAAARQRFPRLTLSSTLGLLAFNPGDLFDEDSLVYTLAGGLTAPLFDGGRINAEMDLAAANKRAAYEAWRGAVFTGLGEAEAGYGLVAAADAEAAAADAERAGLERAARLADTRYRAGLSDFLTVLEARRNADASGERAAAAKGRALRARVALWQALGGTET